MITVLTNNVVQYQDQLSMYKDVLVGSTASKKRTTLATHREEQQDADWLLPLGFLSSVANGSGLKAQEPAPALCTGPIIGRWRVELFSYASPLSRAMSTLSPLVNVKGLY